MLVLAAAKEGQQATDIQSVDVSAGHPGLRTAFCRQLGSRATIRLLAATEDDRQAVQV